MSETYLRRISRNLFSVLVLSFVVMCLGNFVRSNDAGLSCPDWPLCYGQLVPIFDFRIFLEWFHRLLAGLLGFNLLYVVFLILRSKEARALFASQLFAACTLLIVQVILGGLTVLQLINPGIVSLHLINAVLFFGVLISLFSKAEQEAMRIAPGPKANIYSRPLHVFSVGLVLLLFTQIFVGGMVSTNFAGTVCPDFPRCFGSWWPGDTFLIGLQMSHRLLGFALAALLFVFSAVAMYKPGGAHTKRAARVLPVLVVLQIILGAINVTFSLPPIATLLHLANAIAMFALALLSCFELSAAKQSIEPAHMPENVLVT